MEVEVKVPGFVTSHVNRKEFPTRYALIVEDDSEWQAKILNFCTTMLGNQSNILFVCCPSAVFAKSAFEAMYPMMPTFMLLDHDMPWGDGVQLMKWMFKHVGQDVVGAVRLPVCAISGIPQNNKNLTNYGAQHIAKKGDWFALEEFLRRFK